MNEGRMKTHASPCLHESAAYMHSRIGVTSACDFHSATIGEMPGDLRQTSACRAPVACMNCRLVIYCCSAIMRGASTNSTGPICMFTKEPVSILTMPRDSSST